MRTTASISIVNPWVTRDVADVLKRRQEGFSRDDREAFKQLQKEARTAMLKNKKLLDKVEDSFASNNSRKLSSSLQTMTGHRPNKKPLNV